jgi:hypothetical protein
MALFSKSDPETGLQKAIASERALRDKLEALLIAARKTQGERQNDARKATRDLADDKTIIALEDKQGAAERRVSNTSLELAESNNKLTELEAQLATATDHRQRKETASEVEALAIGLVEDAVNFGRAAEALASRAESISRFIQDGVGLGVYARSIHSEVPAAVECIRGVLQGYVASVLNGSAPARLPQPAPVAAPLLLAPQTTRVFATRDICWTADGVVLTQHRWTDVELPPAVAVRALKLGATVPMDSPVRKKTARVCQELGEAEAIGLRRFGCRFSAI